MRIAYADPPYPGKAHLYPENTEVDHAELVERLCQYDGWALSTDERSLRYVLNLCPDGVRVLAWCKRNVQPWYPNPVAAWEPVLCWPARKAPISVRSYAETEVTTGFRQRQGLTGQKPPAFCEWVLRCIGANPEEDELDDLYPGTGVMGEAWERFRSQMPLFTGGTGRRASAHSRRNQTRRTNLSIPGIEPPRFDPERHHARAKTEEAA